MMHNAHWIHTDKDFSAQFPTLIIVPIPISQDRKGKTVKNRNSKSTKPISTIPIISVQLSSIDLGMAFNRF